MVELKVKPLNPSATTMDTLFAFPGTANYKAITSGSGSAALAAGTQADRTAKALALVKKYYPNASATNAEVDIKFLFADTPLRIDLAKLINAEAKKAGFNVSTTPHPDIFGVLEPTLDPAYDALMFGGSLTAITQALTTATYKTEGSGNYYGYSDPAVDKLMNSLEGDYLTAAQVLAKRAEAAKLIYERAWNTPLYQNVTLTAYSKALNNIKPSPLSPNIVWNYWQWHF
jgi:peptide/nickel transport system substrate-binding protein